MANGFSLNPVYLNFTGDSGRDKFDLNKNKSERIDVNDHQRLRHGREQYTGFEVGHYVQTPPLLFTRDAHSIFLGDFYRGSSAFLIAGGPSFLSVDKEKLNKAGCLTMGLNNSVKTFRPNLWTCVDDPTHFIKSIWLDSKITKFVPFDHAEKNIFDNENWKMMDLKVGDCPSVLFYRRNERFKADQFLFENTINWGNHSDLDGGRSVMLVALRLLYYLGIRNVFLLGVDFKMSETQKYHFEQDRSNGSIKGNNYTYTKLIERFTELKPYFEKVGFNVFNCNKESELKVFSYMDFDEAVSISIANLPKDIENERTSGLYERKSKEKEKTKNSKVVKEDVIKTEDNEDIKKKVKSELDRLRLELDTAKADLEQWIIDNEKNDKISFEEGKKKLEDIIVEARRKFKEKEKEKNKIWYGR